MRRNINDAINSFYLPKNISYQIVINLLILKTLSKKEFYYGFDFTLWVIGLVISYSFFISINLINFTENI